MLIIGGTVITAIADVDQDGTDDFVCTNKKDMISWYKNNGGLNFEEYIIGNDLGSHSLLPIDYDLDSDMDYISSHTGGNNIVLWLNSLY